jgi:plastocyanin
MFLTFGPGGGVAKAAIIFNAHVHDDYFHPTGTFVPGPAHATAQALCMGATPDPTCTARIFPGDSVNWVAPAPLAVNPHSVTECTDGTWTTCGAGSAPGNPIEDSGVRFQPGWPYVVQFNNTGTFYYRCEIHPTTMRGAVKVSNIPAGVGGTVDVFLSPGSDDSEAPYLLLSAIAALTLAGMGGFAWWRRFSGPTL